MTAREDRGAAKRIALFNHKGGVGKTTITVNVASALAASGAKVLLIDSDPQCNLSAYLIEDDVLNLQLDESDSEKGQTIWSALKPVAEGAGDFKAVSPIEVREGLFLLPGDIRLAEFEEELVGLWGECFKRKQKGYRGTTALSQLINELVDTYSIDFVFYDSGPNIGPLNRVILLDADYFAIPAACDLFSLRAITTLGLTLASWIEDWGTVIDLAPDDVYLLPGAPRLLGYVPQRFRTYRNLPAAQFAEMLPKLERRVQSDVATPLRRIRPNLVTAGPLKLGEIKEFNTLATASQIEGVPLGEVTKGTQEQRDEANATFEELANAIRTRIAADPE